mmetsp:Transcript_11723/g.35726  ORF Transcript_11723/g.35726 Transcript_11723/m.35726 type:complete len:88 (+) Transcript_11723:1110-1373(+)
MMRKRTWRSAVQSRSEKAATCLNDKQEIIDITLRTKHRGHTIHLGTLVLLESSRDISPIVTDINTTAGDLAMKAIRLRLLRSSLVFL